MRKICGVMIVIFCLILPFGTGFGEYGIFYDDAEAYVRALEEAMDARYEGREAWPQGFDTMLTLVKHCSGIDMACTPTLAWAPEWARRMEENILAGKADQPQNIVDFLHELRLLMKPADPLDRFGRSWPYEAQALITAAYVYSGNTESCDYAGLPTDGDLPQEEAIAIARETIQKQFALPDEDIDQLPVYTQFCVGQWFDTVFWSVTIGLNEYGYELYYVYIASPTGEVLVSARNDGNG